MSELLRSVEAPRMIFGYDFPGLPGLRQLAFSVMLVLLILFAQRGLMGGREFSWDWIRSKLKRQASQASKKDGGEA
jgi:branched-chain amino acid transport system permease protein